MTKSNFENVTAASPGYDAEPENVTESFGPAADTGEDLAYEGSGKEIVKPTFDGGRPAEDQKDNGVSEPIAPTLDPICGKSVDEDTLLHLERDGKIFYFCSEQCLQTFISTIAGVKSESKAGSCCG
ncbi:YHS domain-containing protein [Pirellulaceae bacterium SH449]